VALPFGVGLHQPGDGGELHGINDGAHVDGLVERVADAEAVHARAELAVEGGRHALLHESREPAQQTWPWLNQIASTSPSTAESRSASSKTM
jgi:hypothetical protein